MKPDFVLKSPYHYIMDYRTEKYDTLIDGVVITFEVKWIGSFWEENLPGYWIAEGDGIHVTDMRSSESAALELVKLIENGK